MNKYICIISESGENIDLFQNKFYNKYKMQEYTKINVNESDPQIPNHIDGQVIILLYKNMQLHTHVSKYDRLTIIGMNDNASIQVNEDIIFSNTHISFDNIRFEFATNKNIKFNDNKSVIIKNCQFLQTKNNLLLEILNNMTGISKNIITFNKYVQKINIKNNIFQSIAIIVENNKIVKNNKNSIIINGSSKINNISQISTNNNIRISGSSNVENIYQNSNHGKNNIEILGESVVLGNIVQNCKNANDLCETNFKCNTFTNSNVTINRKNELYDNYVENSTIISNNY